MIAYQEALSKILANTSVLPPKRLSIDRMLGLGLAEPVIAPFDQPRFDNSAVDGFGVKVEDLRQASENTPIKLTLVSTVRAGSTSDLCLQSGQTVKLSTGSFVPNGVEAIVMREFCFEEAQTVRITKSVNRGENIRCQASEFRSGQEILPAGLRVDPPTIGLLASLGYCKYLSGSKPKVGLMITGDEIIAPGRPITSGHIYDANSFSLKAALLALGIEKVDSHFSADKYKQVKNTLRKILNDNDIVISSGGVSVGDFDFIKQALDELGVETIFWRVAVKPGRPIYFGILESKKKNIKKLIFGLPGNTVSVLMTFHQFVKPVILKMMSVDFVRKQTIKAFLTNNLSKPAGRLELVRASLSWDSNGITHITPANGQESHMLSGLVAADSVVYFAADETNLETGNIVNAEKLSWFD